MEAAPKEVEKLEVKTPGQIAQEENERYEAIVKEEKELARKAKETAMIADEALPPTIRKDEYGNEMPHLLMDGEYVPLPIAEVRIQERKLVMEYRRLEQLKKIEEDYHKASKK